MAVGCGGGSVADLAPSVWWSQVFLGLQGAFFLYLHIIILYAYLQIPPLHKDTAILDEGPP